MMRDREKPSARAASTNSSSRSDRKLARTMRVMPSQPVRPSTRMTVFSLRPRIVAMATASTMYGIARNTSVRRMMSVSVTAAEEAGEARRGARR